MIRKVPMPDWPIWALSCVGAAMVLIGTHWGLGMSPDSATYLGVSANLTNGRGLTVPFGELIDKPLGSFPPLYPILIGLLTITGLDTGQAARLLQILLLVINLFMLQALIQGESEDANLGRYVVVILYLTSPIMIMLHLMAWSEALFISLGFSGTLFLIRAVRTESTARLIIGTICIGLSGLVRYAGVAFILTGFFYLLVNRKSIKGSSIQWVVTYMVIAIIPLSLWLMNVLFVSGAGTGRRFSIHLPELGVLQTGLTTISSWMGVPAQWPGSLKAIAAILLGVGLILIAIKSPWSSFESAGDLSRKLITVFTSIQGAMFLFCAVYLVTLLVTIAYFDANTPLDERLLSPLLVAVMVILSSGFELQELPRSRFHVVRFSIPIILLFFLISRATTLPDIIQTAYQEGLGFNSYHWRNSATIQYIRSIPEAEILYSNSPEAIYAQTQRPSFRLPKPYLGVFESQNSAFEGEIMQVEKNLRGNSAKIVYFNTIQGSSIPDLEKLEEMLPLHIVYSNEDAIVFTGNP